MRILIPVFSMVSYRAPPKTVFNLIRGLSSYDVEITLLSAEVDPNFKFPKNCNVEKSLSKRRIIKNVRVIRNKGKSMDLVYIPISKEALYISRMVKETPIVAGPNVDITPYIKHKITNVSCDLYIAYNKHLKGQLIRWGLDREKVKILPHAIDIEYYSPDKKDEHFWNKFGLDNLNNNILLFVGRLERHKGIVNLIKSFVSYIYPSYPNSTLVVISSGGTYEDYVTQVSKKHNAVIFLKMLPEEYMPVAYASADVGVFPSEREGFGMVCLESMASGTPTVGVNAGGPKEIISDGYNGILMPDNSEKSIYEAVG